MDKNQFKKTISNLRFAFGILLQSLSISRMGMNFLIGTGRALLPILTAYVTKIIIDEANKAYHEPFIGKQIFIALIILVMATIAIKAMESVLEIIQKKMRETDMYNIAANIQLRIIDKAKTNDQKHFDHHETYNIISRGTGFSEDSIFLLYFSTEVVLRSMLSTIGYAFILFHFNWIVGMIALGVEGIKYYRMKKRIEDTNDLTRTITELNRKKNYYAEVLKSPSYSKEVRMFKSKDYFLRLYTQMRHKAFSLSQKVYIRNNTRELLVNILSYFVSFCVYGYILYQALNKSITIGDVTLLYLAYTNISETFKDTFDFINNFYKSAMATEYFRNYLSIQNDIICDKHDEKVKADFQNGITIEFVNVSFKYPGRDEYILENISFKVTAPQTIAIVGLNGAGKSTLVKLLLRMYDPTEGYILVNNIRLTDYDSMEYYRNWSVLFQDYKQYAMRLSENINLDDEITDIYRMNEAIDVSQVRAFLPKMSNGLDTQLTRNFFSDGYVPSGGEAQRIALARAVYFAESVVVLDEPSASIDALSEYEIFKRMEIFNNERLVFMISHRLSNVVNADFIIVLDQRTIIETGSHAELLNSDGVYSKLFKEQAKWYNKEFCHEDLVQNN